MTAESFASGLTWLREKEECRAFLGMNYNSGIFSCTIWGTGIFNTILSIGKKSRMHGHPQGG